MTRLRILDCGAGTSIQDKGRFGWLRYGISSSGAADPLALAAANALVGNPAGTEAIELVFMGATLEAVGGAARLALAGARMPMHVDGRAVPGHTSFLLEAGQRLVIGAATAGVYAMLAAAGGLDVPAVLGSKSLHRRAGIGGGALVAGQELPLKLDEPLPGGALHMPPLPLGDRQALRVVLGPQADYATAAGLDTFLSSTFEITSEVDRMACRLGGPPIELARGFNIVSDGIVPGSVQIPGSGHPIVMLADRQTTGGYPKIATIITPDLRLLVQRRAGEAVRFRGVSIDEAQAVARRAAAEAGRIAESLQRATRTLDDCDQLLSINFAGHASSAIDPVTWQP